MTPTPSQQSALTLFESFVDSKENNVFILKGSAGTGKTTLMKTMIKSLGDKWDCVLIAPTGRAAFVLSQRTDRNASTIHRTIYTIEEGLKDDGTGQLKFGLRPNNDPLSRTMYFVDEASMISDAYSENDMFMFGSGYLLKDLFQYCGSRKIIFVGDYAQLPPIGQPFSPAMNAKYLQENYKVSCAEAMLREVVRQDDDSAILKNAQTIRDAIEADTYNQFAITDGGGVAKCDSIMNAYKATTNGAVDENTIVIAYSNKQVLDYNLKIRKLLWGETAERLLPGDLIVISQNNYAYPIELFNGTIVKVIACDTDSQLEKRKVKFRTSGKDEHENRIVKELVLLFRKATIQTTTNDQVEMMILDNFLTESLSSLSLDYRQAIYADFNNRMAQQNVKKGSDRYKDLMKTDKYFNALICKYGYSSTCHKAQGGEWENVFVDMDKLGGKTNNGYFRWAYTAITRSRRSLWHFASPEFNAVNQMKVLPISNINRIAYYVPSGENFLDWHLSRIQSVCATQGINCAEISRADYKHLLSFEKDDKRCAILQWYCKEGYTPKRDKYSATDENFYAIVKELFEKALLPDILPFEPKSDFAKQLNDFVLDTALELGITVQNIKQEQWKDIYYLKTTPYESAITFCYNAKGIYSSVMPQSTGGANDEMLKEFCDKIQ